ncbi:MAG TPA: ferrochelatase [Coriobacteriia bacterium]
MAKTGVLLIAFGGPDCLEAVEPFMCNVMGRTPSPETVQSVWRKYLTIGGASPLPFIAESIASALERRLNGLPSPEAPSPGEEQGMGALTASSSRAVEGVDVPVVVGMLHWRPSIAAAVDSLKDRGVERVVWTSLSPFESSVTSGAYRAAVTAACDAAGLKAVEGDRYHDAPALVSLLSDACAAAVGELPEHKPAVVFTAHSLPAEEAGDDPYVTQLEALATEVAGATGLGDPDAVALESALGIRAHGGPGKTAPWLLAYQSQGAKPGSWLGPTLDDVIDAAQAHGVDSLVVCPIGFVTDHLETLWDLDVDAADKVLSRDMEFARAKAPNDDPALIGVLADAVSRHL